MRPKVSGRYHRTEHGAAEWKTDPQPPSGHRRGPSSFTVGWIIGLTMGILASLFIAGM